jgi:DNA-binding CsgD family transcriptional regulator
MRLQDLAAQWVDHAQTARSLSEVRLRILTDIGAALDCPSIYWGGLVGSPANDGSVFMAPDGEARRAIARFVAHRERYTTPHALRAVRAAGGAALLTDIYSVTDLERRPVYREVIHPAGMRTVIGAEVTFRGQPRSALRLGRHDRRPLGPRDKEFVRQILGLLGLLEAAFSAGALRPEPDGGGPRSHLPPRLGEVAEMVARGLGNKEIAALLGTSLETVRKQTSAIYDRLGLRGRAELVWWWSRQSGDARPGALLNAGPQGQTVGESAAMPPQLHHFKR